MMDRIMRGERASDLAREYGISRKTADKFKQRFKRLGESGLLDQSRAPKVIPHRTPPELAEIIVAERKQHSTWGAKKLKKVLERRLGRPLPSVSTVASILERAGLLTHGTQRPLFKSTGTKPGETSAPNELWCIDYKGQFRLGDRSLCYPLTITDQHSRFLLCCDGMAAICEDAARESCEEVFRTFGLPRAIRSDNGVPFASTGLAGLSKLSVFWMRLGIQCERGRPGHPEDNAQHERMHRTLKAETTRPAGQHLLVQQERFDGFRDEFNHERPHEALGMKCPSEVYTPSTIPLPAKLAELSYPQHDDVLTVRSNGTIFFRRRSIHCSQALAGQDLGIREEDDGRWLLSFMTIDLGYITDRKLIAFGASTPPEAA